MAADAAGTPREWSFEMQSVQQDSYAGWRPDSVKAGDRVTIEFHPLKDGSRGGQLMSATLANGQHLGPPALSGRQIPAVSTEGNRPWVGLGPPDDRYPSTDAR